MADHLTPPRAEPLQPARPDAPAAPDSRAATWGLGIVALVLLGLVAATGVGLTFYYRPTPELAHLDLVDLRETSAFAVLRDWHRWASHAVLILVFLHLLRTFLARSYRGPWRGVWLGGIVLVPLVVAAAATGSLLPWNPEGVGGVRDLMAALRFEPSAATLRSCYALHVVVLPLAAVVVLVDHLRRIRRARDRPDPGDPR